MTEWPKTWQVSFATNNETCQVYPGAAPKKGSAHRAQNILQPLYYKAIAPWRAYIYKYLRLPNKDVIGWASIVYLYLTMYYSFI